MGIILISAGLLLLAGIGLYHRYKPLPQGLGQGFPWRNATDIRFLADTRYRDRDHQPRMDRTIVPAMVDLISTARRLVVLDIFLFNPDQANDPDHVPATETLTQALLARKEACPELQITLIVDPINTHYGAVWPEHLQRLEAAGARIIVTRLTALRDGNPLWSCFWRLLFQWQGNRHNGGWLPSPLGPHRVTLRTWLTLPNFKANHRKVLVVDQGQDVTAMVSSANVHDASSCHSNVALCFSGETARDVLNSESAVAVMSGREAIDLSAVPLSKAPPENGPRLRLLTEAAIRDSILTCLGQARPGDHIDLALFYLSHRPVIRALKNAHSRGVRLRLLLDPNKDAFGHTKAGMPNRQVARELHRHGIPVRWYATRGEQFHSKLLYRHPAESGHVELLLGSANYTRRNLDNLNLESAVQLQGPEDHPAMADASRWFQGCWHNRDGDYTTDYTTWADERAWRYWLYRLMEASGWCAF